ncbi:MAG: hypothetical protein FJW35_10570, partial [Acidobacteria bacterium]|nr:hypothetical protein [Acidobacteriota bacterium]
SRDRSTIVGTLPYMAPEQIRSGFVDIRSDIYAVGNVLYEMATGRRPFQEEPPSVLHLAIMGRRPLPPCKHRPALSRRLEKAILRCLKKDPADRWQTTEELLSALRHIESAAGKAKSEDGKDVWRIARLVSVPASALLAILAFLWIWPRPAPFPATAPFRVTMAAGWEGEPAISPDGSRVLYTSDAGGNLDVYWVDIRGGDPVQITDDDAVDKDPSWFPDGSNIAFASDRGGAWSIWKVSQSGGGATLLVPGAEHPAISPDGSRLAFAAVPGAGQHTRIGVAPLADPAEIRMLTHDGDGLWDHTHPAWSPDGRSVTYGCRHDLWTVPVEGGPAHRLTTDAEPESEPVYSPNGRYIYFSSERDGVPALWRVPAKGGRAERITTSSVPESHPSISKDCRRLAYSSGGPLHHITLLDRQSGKETVLSDLESDIMAAIAPDNSRIVFPSQRHDTDINLWMQLLENGAPVGSPRRLTDHEGVASYPCFSPDGQWIAYYRVLGEARNIWIIPSSGGLPQQFTGTAATDVHPAWSNNGSAIAFVSDREGGYQVWAAAIENGRPAGNPRRLTDGETIPGSPHWSPDDSRISFIGRDAGSRDVYVVDVRQSRSARRLTRGADARQVRWDRATGSLLVSGTWDSGNLHIRAIAAEDGRFLNHLPAIDLGAGGASEAQGLFDVSADGSLLIFSRATRRGDIWVLEATTKGVF